MVELYIEYHSGNNKIETIYTNEILEYCSKPQVKRTEIIKTINKYDKDTDKSE
jgi:hypothetical protein